MFSQCIVGHQSSSCLPEQDWCHQVSPGSPYPAPSPAASCAAAAATTLGSVSGRFHSPFQNLDAFKLTDGTYLLTFYMITCQEVKGKLGQVP